MNFLRLGTGVLGVLTGTLLVGYTLGWMLLRVAQLVVGTVAVGSGALLLVIGANRVMEEVGDQPELSKAVKSAQKRINRKDLSRAMNSAHERREHLQREASKLWR